MEWYHFALIIAGGFTAGFVNTLAGNGSLITLPLLMMLGLPANLANGTNRVAILLQNAVSGSRFNAKGVMDVRGAVRLGIPALLGSAVGAQLAASLNEEMMRMTIGVVMVLMVGLMLLRPKRWLEGAAVGPPSRIRWPHVVLFFFIGAYGGFIQAGVGIFLLAALVLGAGYDLVRANAVKVGIILLQSLAALIVFLRIGQVQLTVGLVLAIGTMLGAWAASSLAVQSGAVWVHRFLILVVTLSALHLLGVTQLLAAAF